MKQLHIIGLIFILLKYLIKYGNVPVWYHGIGCPKEHAIEAELVEMRDTRWGEKKLTIW